MASSSSGLVEWEVIVPIGPVLAHHTSCVIDNSVYVHGGISNYGSTSPLNGLFRLSLIDQIWNQILIEGSPCLSHHTSIALNDRYMLLIGGWNGKKRSGDLHAYDTREQKWIEPSCQGFPPDAGLSSHTAALLSNRDILILGREGSLRLQRRTGNAYLLQGSVEKGFKYTEYGRSIMSRSGHTTNIVRSKMVVIGGRSDNLLDMEVGFSSGANDVASSLDDVVSAVAKLKPMTKLPCGRKHHVAMSGPNCVFLHGGETFDGRSRVPVGEMFLISINPNVQFYNLGSTKISRAGHVCFTDGVHVYIHGGFSGKQFMCCDLCKLNVSL